MAPKSDFIVLLTILLFVNVLSISPCMVSASSSALVSKVCNGHANHEFCLKALGNPQADASKNLKQLANALMKSASSSAQSTLDVIVGMSTKPTSPMALQALKTCEEAYTYAVKSFGMIPRELDEDAMSANYDISVIGPEVDKCIQALAAARLDAPQIVDGNKNLQSYSALGNEITATLE